MSVCYKYIHALIYAYIYSIVYVRRARSLFLNAMCIIDCVASVNRFVAVIVFNCSTTHNVFPHVFTQRAVAMMRVSFGCVFHVVLC